MNMLKGAASAFLAMLILLGGATPARADDAFHTACENWPNTICLVQNGTWTGTVWRQTPSQIYSASGHCRNLTTLNNAASLAYNNASGYVLRVRENNGCTGRYVQVSSGLIISFSGSQYGWMNDIASSVSLIAL